jgi:hypothetical protein
MLPFDASRLENCPWELRGRLKKELFEKLETF